MTAAEAWLRTHPTPPALGAHSELLATAARLGNRGARSVDVRLSEMRATLIKTGGGGI